MRRDLSREDLEDRRQRQEVFSETNDGANDSSFRELLQEEGKESCRVESGVSNCEQYLEEEGEGGNEPIKKTMKMEMTQRLIQS
jgi:hypothetical protein